METCKQCLKPEKFCTCIDAHTKHGKHNEYPLNHNKNDPKPVVEKKVEASQPAPVAEKPAEDLISGSGNMPWSEPPVEEKPKHKKGWHKSKK